MQLSKFTSKELDIIVLYRSKQGNKHQLNELLKQLETRNVPQIVIGDFNFHYLEQGANVTMEFFKEKNYEQLILEPTHIEGNVLDQAYKKDVNQIMEYTVETHAKYYTDHRAITLVVKPGEKNNLTLCF